MKEHLFIVLTAVGWSTAGMIVKYIPWGTLAVAGCRGMIGLLSLIAFQILRDHCSLRAALPKPTWVNFRVGIYQFCTSTFYILAIRYTTVANACVLQYIAPLLVMLWNIVVQRQRLQKMDVLLTCVVFFGCVLSFAGELSGGAWMGNLFAVASGFALAGQIITSRVPSANVHDGLSWGCLLSAVCFLPFLLAEPAEHFSLPSIAAMLFLGIVQYSLSNIFYILGIEKTDALTASLILTLEPVLAPVWAFLTLKETPTTTALAGLLLVVTGSATHSLLKKKRQSRDRLGTFSAARPQDRAPIKR